VDQEEEEEEGEEEEEEVIMEEEEEEEEEDHVNHLDQEQCETNYVIVMAKSPLRRVISHCLSKLRKGEEVTLEGYTDNISKVVVIAEILKERLGWLHQVTNFTTKSKEQQMDGTHRKSRRTSREVGIIVTLAMRPLEKNDVGYQRPKPPKELISAKWDGQRSKKNGLNKSQSRSRDRKGGQDFVPPRNIPRPNPPRDF